MSDQKNLTGTVKSILLGAGLVFVTQPAFAGIDIDIKAIFGSEQKTVEQPATKKGPPDHAPAHGYRAKHRYQYYPSAQVYFDPARSLYFYLSSSQWKISASLPNPLKLQLGSHVSIEMDSDKPYSHHSEHKKKYPPGQAKKNKAHKKHKVKYSKGHKNGKHK
ncbi:hypothetical protein [Kaarinaea lacus]